MASIKVKFRPSATDSDKGSIYYQIYHRNHTSSISPGIYIRENEWDNDRSTVSAQLPETREQIKRDMTRLRRIVNRLEATTGDYTANDVTDEYYRYSCQYTLSTYMNGLIADMRINGRMRTAETYGSAMRSFQQFYGDQQLPLDRITAKLIEHYEGWLRMRGLASNTTSFYIRIIRAVYNRAADDGIIEGGNPFRRVYTGVSTTIKRALPLSFLRKIKRLDLKDDKKASFARDMFLLSFYLRGMSFVDMAYLRKDNLQNGYVIYRRRKTGQTLTIKWTGEMQSILDKYPPNPTHYLLPIIYKPGLCERSAYRNTGYNINRHLKRIGISVGLDIPLTLYCARHSWASTAQAKGIPVSVISQGMGHNSESTTRIYLTSIDTSMIDKANAIVLRSL